MTPPAPATGPDRPTTGPLVIGPVRGLWSTRDPDSVPWGVVSAPVTAALVVGFLESRVDSWSGEGATAVIVAVLAAAAYIGLIILIFQSFAYGEASWRVDDQGVSHTPPKREPSFLAWDDVEQVRLLTESTLRGRGIQVRFPRTLPETDRNEVVRRIREHLGGDFDLESRPRSQASIGSFLRLLAIGLAVTAAFFATTVGPMLTQDFGGPRIAWIGRTFLFCWMLLFIVGMTRLRRSETQSWIPRRSANHPPTVPATETRP